MQTPNFLQANKHSVYIPADYLATIGKHYPNLFPNTPEPGNFSQFFVNLFNLAVELQANNTQLINLIEESKLKTAELEANIAAAEDIIADLNTQISTLQTNDESDTVNQLTEQVNNLSEKVNLLKSENEILVNQSESFAAEVEALEYQLETLSKPTEQKQPAEAPVIGHNDVLLTLNPFTKKLVRKILASEDIRTFFRKNNLNGAKNGFCDLVDTDDDKTNFANLFTNVLHYSAMGATLIPVVSQSAIKEAFLKYQQTKP